MKNIQETLEELYECFKSQEFKANRKTGDFFVKQYMNMEFIEWLYKRDVIGILECNTLALVFNPDAQPLSRGSKSKIKRLLIRKVKPFVESQIIRVDKEDVHVELELPTVDDILKEVREDKLPVKITGMTNKKSEVNTNIIDKTNNEVRNNTEQEVKTETQKAEAETQEVKAETQEVEQETQEVEQEVEQEVKQPYLKGIMTINQKVLFKQFRNRTYQKENIEVAPNLRIGDIVGEAGQLENEKVDIVIMDKRELSLICAVLVMDERFNLDTLKLLNQLEIKTFIIPLEDGIMNSGSIRAVEEHINNLYAPVCVMCGLPMRQRENIRTKHRFYACLDNKNCRYTIDMGD